MKIGARIIKTSIAVTITMFICQVTKLEPAVFGAVSAVVNMQPSIYLTFKTAKNQILIHLLGVSVGIIAGYLLGGNPLTIGLITALIIVLYMRLKLQNGIMMGVVAAIFILSSRPEQFLAHAFSRSLVIFIGLGVAMLINIILWPPRYSHLFIAKLRESNTCSVDYFCQAVFDFIRLEDQIPVINESLREKVFSFNRETRNLAEHFRREKNNNIASYNSDETEQWFCEIEHFMDYNEALTDKADRIYELIPARIERRRMAGNHPVSDEFHSILDILASGCSTITRVNDKLTKSLCDRISMEPEKISENYWEKLMAAIERWQPLLTGSYYLHALLETAVVANEIRWASREAKKLLISSQKTLL